MINQSTNIENTINLFFNCQNLQNDFLNKILECEFNSGFEKGKEKGFQDGYRQGLIRGRKMKNLNKGKN